MYKKTKGMMMGGAMKAKGMKKGGKVKSTGGMRKPSSKTSGLFGRVKKMNQGGSMAQAQPGFSSQVTCGAPAGASGGLSPAQQRMLRSAQSHAANTGQMPDELKRLTAQHGDLNAMANRDMAAAKRRRRQQGAPRRGRAPGMKGGGPIGGKKKK